MKQTIERRVLPIEVRVASDDSGKRRITGHAAIFDTLSEPLYGFREKIDPGAFSDTIKDDDIRALWNHDPNFVLGRNRSGTLKLKEDKTGLQVEIDAPDTQWARDLLVSIERGDVSQMSFGFRTIDDIWEKKEGELIRTLRKVECFDVSPVTFPAYVDTDVSVRSSLLESARAAGKLPVDEPPADPTPPPSSGPPVDVLRRRLQNALL